MERETTAVKQVMVMLLLAGLAGCPPPAPVGPQTRAAAERLEYCVTEGEGHNCMVRDSLTAAHVLATSGSSPRLVVAFPAGNSGAAIWATPRGAGRAELTVVGPLKTFRRGRLAGVRFKVRSTTDLDISGVVAGSIRTIRDYNHHHDCDHYMGIVRRAGAALSSFDAEQRSDLLSRGITKDGLGWRAQIRRVISSYSPAHFVVDKMDLSGAYRMRFVVRCDGGRLERNGDLVSLSGKGPLVLKVEVATTHSHLPGLPQRHLLRPAARRQLTGAGHQAALRSLRFLATRRKMMAGSWRFLTYFGRDTLMSLWLLRPVLSPAALEAGLQSVLDNLSPDGMVAHEESLGDQAALERLDRFAKLAGQGKKAEAMAELDRLKQPTFAYTMVDDDLMLLLVADAYLRDPAVSKGRAAAFLDRKTSGGATNLESLARNLDYVLGRAAPYAASGKATDLVSLRPGADAGDWRDSGAGLGHGRYPASVNAYLMPAALEAAARVLGSRKLKREDLLAAGRRGKLQHLMAPDLSGRLQAMVRRWSGAHAHFAVRLDAAEVQRRLESFLSATPAMERSLLRARLGKASVAGMTFDALALDAAGKPAVEVMHTDDGFALLARDLPLARVGQLLVKYEQVYPLGLRHPFGVYVANPALSSRATDRRTFDRGMYHGTVVWAWQQGLLQLGLMRQLQRCHRAATPAATRLARRIRRVLKQIAKSEERVGALRGSELWGVRMVDGRLRPGPFRPGAGHATESNALQLWSNISLAVDLERKRLGL